MDGDMSFETVLVDPVAPMATATPTSVDEVAPVVDMQVEQSIGADGVVDVSTYAGVGGNGEFTNYTDNTPIMVNPLSQMTNEEREEYMAQYYGHYGLEDPMVGMYPELGRGIYKAALQDGCPGAAASDLNKKLMQQSSKPAPSGKVGDIVSGIRASRTAFSTNTLSATPTISTSSISSHSIDDGGMLP